MPSCSLADLVLDVLDQIVGEFHHQRLWALVIQVHVAQAFYVVRGHQLGVELTNGHHLGHLGGTARHDAVVERLAIFCPLFLVWALGEVQDMAVRVVVGVIKQQTLFVNRYALAVVIQQKGNPVLAVLTAGRRMACAKFFKIWIALR